MPLVTLTRCFEGRPLPDVPPSLAGRRQNPEHLGRLALKLQCFLELTGRTLVDLDVGCVKDVIDDFVAAEFSTIFCDPATRTSPWNSLGLFRKTLPAGLRPFFPCSHNKDGWPRSFRERVRYFDEIVFPPEAVEFWTGWIVQNARGKKQALVLWRFWERFGAMRTREFFRACHTWFASGNADRVPVVDRFAAFLVERSNDVDFESPTSMGRAVNAFLHKFFRDGYSEGMRVATLTAQWGAFKDLLNNHVLGHVWATAIPAVPEPVRRKVRGSSTQIRASSRGHEVKIALITPVPLQVTDTEAKELLFRDIQREAHFVLAWACHETREARLRLDRRRESASTVSLECLRRRPLTDVPPEVEFARAAAKFEANGFDHLDSGLAANAAYASPLAKTAWDLGIPTPALLLAHATVLVGNHPKITPAFLSSLELFDRDGKQVGLVETDAGWYLRGFKRRKGELRAQQEVLLTAETLRVVRDLIELTEPLRAWLRARNSAHWRKLFLASASMGQPPNYWHPNGEASRQVDWLAERFLAFASHPDTRTGDGPALGWMTDFNVARDLATRFSLRRLRSSFGVLKYLETGSVELMAKELGHEEWSPKLLDHYLPRVIQEFFTERWIRLFQEGIICEALKDSSFLLEASSFQSMDELDTFLEHHALRRIPAHMDDPDRIGGQRQQSSPQARVAFGIDLGILTILTSIESAVRISRESPCGRAIRWARISERLGAFLETQVEQPEFRSMICEARRRASPNLVEALIHD